MKMMRVSSGYIVGPHSVNRDQKDMWALRRQKRHGCKRDAEERRKPQTEPGLMLDQKTHQFT
jgi:hypothetical protein